MITFAAIVYTILFAVNLGFAAIDWDGLLLPVSVKYVFIGCAGGGDCVKAYRKGPLYFIEYNDHGPIAITRDEYKYCTVFTKNQFMNLKKQVGYDSSQHSWCAVYIKFPFREEATYDLSKAGGFQYKVLKLYLKKTKHLEWINDSILSVFEENNVTNGYYLCLDSGHMSEYDDEAFYRDTPNFVRTSDDERFRKIHDMYMAEYANLRLCSEGTTKLPYPGRSTTVMEKLVEYESGQTPSKYLYNEDYSRDEIMDCPYYLTEEGNKYLNDAMTAYMKLRYFDHMLKGPEIVYYKIKSYKDMTIMTYVIPAENKTGYIEFVTDNPLSREKTIQDLKLVIATHGKCPIIKYSNVMMHAAFIMIVQNSIFGAVCLLADPRKRKLVVHK